MERRIFNTVLIDLDDTLYTIPEFPSGMSTRIQEYMRAKLGVPEDKVPGLSQMLYSSYGTTLAGLVAAGHKIDFDDWHLDVHGTLPYELLRPCSRLINLLEQVRLPMYIFTNADDKHAQRCLEIMGIAHLFKGLITFESIQEAGREAGLIHHDVPVICKPNRMAFELALRQAGGADIQGTIFLDDSVRNVASAHKLGIYSVLVGRTGVNSGADAEIPSLLDLPMALPAVWGQMTKQKGSQELRPLEPVPQVSQELNSELAHVHTVPVPS